MDPLTGLLTSGRSGAFLLRTEMCAPFALELADQSPLSLVVAASGGLWVTHPDGDVELPPGAVALVRGDRRWSVADAPGVGTTAVIHPGQRCETISGEPVAERWSLGVRTWGNAGDRPPTHVLLTGTYERIPEAGRALLDALPGVLVLPDQAIDPGLLDWFAGEVVRDDLAQPVVLEGMLDLLVVLAIRHWISDGSTSDAGILRGLADDHVGAAIRLIQSDPARGWTVESLARHVGLSRAAFARRFTELVGLPPIRFLTEWRLALGADRLRTTRDPIARIAAGVGYGNGFAFSTAFRRHHGVSPQQYRTRAGGDHDPLEQVV